MPDEDGIWFDVSPGMLEQATRLAEARLNDPRRRLSPDRKSARNIQSQIRGALGEIVATMWLEESGFRNERGYENDEVSSTDLTVNGVCIEVMTAKRGDRLRTGFCVPPNKLAAARSRGAWGYLFVGTDDFAPPRRLCIQGAVKARDVDSQPARMTYVNNPDYAVLNFVVEDRNLVEPLRFLREIGG